MGGGDLVSINHFVYNTVVLRCLKTARIKLALNDSGFKDVSLLVQLSRATLCFSNVLFNMGHFGVFTTGKCLVNNSHYVSLTI